MKRCIKLTFEALLAIEFILCVLAATILVAVGPAVWFYRLITSERFAWAAVVAIVWFGSVVSVALEVRRKAITAFSFGVFMVWLIVLVYVFHDWFF